MHNDELDIWWTSLSIGQKERRATKGLSTMSPEGKADMDQVRYPACTRWWNSHLDLVKRKAIYHFTCPTCGREFTAYGNAHRKYCSHSCYIEDRFGGAL